MRIITPNQLTGAEGGFSRASTATYVGSDGLLKTAAVDEPRVEYSPITKALAGVLMEPAATNLVRFSQAFDNALWGKTAATISANVYTAPDGTTTADRLVPSTAAAPHFLLLAAPAQSLPSTMSVYVKPDGSAVDKITLHQSGSNTFAHFNLTALTTSREFGVTSSSIVDAGGGWYRLVATWPATFTSVRIYASSGANGASATAGDGVSGPYLFGAQLEVGSAPTSYIPTTSASVTRAADTVTGTYPCLVYSNDEEPCAAWDPLVSYASLNKVRLDSTRRVYQAAAAVPAGGLSPDVNPAWVDAGPTERYACFDASSGTVSANPDTLVIGIRPGLADALALVDVSASQVAVRVYDANATATYATSGRLEDAGRIIDAYTYCFSPPDLRSAVVYTGIPPISSQVMWVVLSEVTLASVGTIAAGTAYEVGQVQYGAQAGIVDYSVKSTDAFGTTTITKRGYAKRINLQARVARADVDSVARKLSRERATALIWDGIDGYDSGVLLGYPKEWQVDITWPTYSTLSITVEGLA